MARRQYKRRVATEGSVGLSGAPQAPYRILVKTYERPACLGRLLVSLSTYCPSIPVTVADDSREPYPCVSKPHPQVSHHILPPRVGLSAGRNWLVRHAPDEYVILMDDDLVVAEDTNLDALIAYVRHGVFDIAGGCLRIEGKPYAFEGWIRQEGTTLYCNSARLYVGPIACDVVLNFIAGKSETFRKVLWDADLKLGEHLDFYMRCQECNIRVGFVPQCQAEHDRGEGDYSAYDAERRELAMKCRRLWATKRNIKNIAGDISFAIG